MAVNNHLHTYEISYYGPEDIELEAGERARPKVLTLRATSATRAINMAFAQIFSEAKASGQSTSRRDYLMLEAKVVPG